MDPFLLAVGACPAIGAETVVRTMTGAGGLVVTVARCPHGSTRYLAAKDGAMVAVLQVVSKDGRDATVANALTVSEHRRTGLARLLLAEARSDFATVRHSDDLSDFGRAFAKATG